MPSAYYHYIRRIVETNPQHFFVETFLCCFVIYITFFKKARFKEQRIKLTEREIDDLCLEWEPEPLVSSWKKQDKKSQCPARQILQDTPTSTMQLLGMDDRVLNFGTVDFLGLGARPEIKSSITRALKKYGCGSCGPRGFYGSIDVHEQLEKDLAAFMRTEAAIIFSDSEATACSTIPCFAKRGDLLIIDKGSNDAILTGSNLSRCRVLYYEHNDLEDLERVLLQVKAEDVAAGRTSSCQRRYVVTEGLFRNSGVIAQLPQILGFCRQHHFRIILDETYSFGVLGESGRGLTEHFGIDVGEIDIICASLSTSVASVGGFSTGSQLVVDNQRINSAGYVFSASAPPFTSCASSTALEIIDAERDSIFPNLRRNTALVHELLQARLRDFVIMSSEDSPLIHLGYRGSLEEDSTQEHVLDEMYQRVVETCLEKGLAISKSYYRLNQNLRPPPTLRLTVFAIHSSEEIHAAVNILIQVLEDLHHLPRELKSQKALKKPTKITLSNKKVHKQPSTPLRRSSRRHNTRRAEEGI